MSENFMAHVIVINCGSQFIYLLALTEIYSGTTNIAHGNINNCIKISRHKKENQVLLNCLYLFEAFGDVESHVSVGDEFPKSLSQQNSYLFVNLVWQEQSFCLQNM